jgi:hypothetical protein
MSGAVPKSNSQKMKRARRKARQQAARKVEAARKVQFQRVCHEIRESWCARTEYIRRKHICNRKEDRRRKLQRAVRKRENEILNAYNREYELDQHFRGLVKLLDNRLLSPLSKLSNDVRDNNPGCVPLANGIVVLRAVAEEMEMVFVCNLCDCRTDMLFKGNRICTLCNASLCLKRLVNYNLSAHLEGLFEFIERNSRLLRYATGNENNTYAMYVRELEGFKHLAPADTTLEEVIRLCKCDECVK